MAEKVTFDGPNKLILINSGETELDAERDIYSAWKRWAMTGLNAMFLQAFRTFGGDPTTGTQTAPKYFYVLNGWRVRPPEEDAYIVISTNLYLDGGGSPVIPTIGNFTSTVEIKNSDSPTVNEALHSRSVHQIWSYYNGTLSFHAWLLEDGCVVDDPLRVLTCEANVYDNADTLLTTISVLSPNNAGLFKGSVTLAGIVEGMHLYAKTAIVTNDNSCTVALHSMPTIKI